MINIFWFRRDLRLNDNAGLYHALKSDKPVLPIFIFDKNILDDLENKKDARVQFIHDTLLDLKMKLEEKGSSLLVKYGKPEEVWETIIKEYNIANVYTNHDYEPYALERDEYVKVLLSKNNISFHSYKDHVVFEKKEVVKKDGLPYTVFTPYSRVWKAMLETRMSRTEEGYPISYFFKPYPTEKYFNNFHAISSYEIPSMEFMGFKKSKIVIPSNTVKQGLIKKYDTNRNFPSINGTSRLGIHFRFGTISIREKAKAAQQINATFLSELIWRDFYAMIMSNFPHVVNNPFRAKYDYIEWVNNEDHFQKWCEGKTGYHIVDAGMRELNKTGFMHNRVRMIVASFLTKHLLTDWRWGEAYFAQKLLDYDLASNNGGWQWAAGCGTDAAPYFRIFNPDSQQVKFDKEMKYIKKWVPEYGTDEYSERIVDHKEARERCLQAFKVGLAKAEN